MGEQVLRTLNSKEKAVLERLLEDDCLVLRDKNVAKRPEVREQLFSSRVEEWGVPGDPSIFLRATSEAVEGLPNSILAEAQAPDIDGGTIRILLHFKSGDTCILEFYKDGGDDAILRYPTPDLMSENLI